MDKHGRKADEPVNQHLTNCAQSAEYLKFYALPDIDAANTIVSNELQLLNAVTENSGNYWSRPFTILRRLLH